MNYRENIFHDDLILHQLQWLCNLQAFPSSAQLILFETGKGNYCS